MSKDDTTKGTYYSFKEGMPTGPDVSALQASYPELKVGDTISYADVEIIIGCEWQTARFKTVTNRWRKRLKEKGIVIDCDAGEAFRVLTADEITAKTYSTFEQIGRKARKQRSNLATIRADRDDQKATVLHHMQMLNATERDARKHRMNLLPGTAIKPPPRLKQTGTDTE